MIHQAVEQFLQFGVITTIKIKKEKEMIFPALTFCADYDSFSSEIIPITNDMIVDCTISENRGLIVGRVLQLYTMKHTLKISHILAFNRSLYSVISVRKIL